ncbi:MAG: Single-stranded DNA-binding protein [Verrucomicrobiaceae bacterium]|nr:Single-stranded DNA-binding protein [Verrucomicrobiaceae bacterium]MDB6119713.1 Single-stranded DNA-binding protein [Verrucomicrobiaceae bacterium]
MPSPALITAGLALRDTLRPLRFSPPITHVYNPLEYAWAPQEQYLQRYGSSRKKVVLLGMNPGPWGMTQTGVPFGEINAVRDWMGIQAPVQRPPVENKKRPIVGFATTQSEVSGRRLWGLFSQKFGTAEAFFKDHFVANYCPLVFMEESGKNFTPDKLPVKELAAVEAACDEHLRAVVAALQPDWLIGVGGFAEAQALKQMKHFPHLKTGRILHPSPASPAANRDWAGVATKQLTALGVW